jgi:hypothetical protein
MLKHAVSGWQDGGGWFGCAWLWLADVSVTLQHGSPPSLLACRSSPLTQACVGSTLTGFHVDAVHPAVLLKEAPHVLLHGIILEVPAEHLQGGRC